MSESTVVESTEIADEETLIRWRAGDQGSGQALIRRHYRAIARFFSNKVPRAAVADLAQEAFLRCLRSTAPVSSVRRYLLGIAYHVLMDHLRARQRESRHQQAVQELSVEQLGVAPDEVLSHKIDKRLLLRALRRLPIATQVVLELSYWEHLSHHEIAGVLRQPAGTVKTRLRSGVRDLRVEIARLAASHEQLHSTIDSLEGWAGRVRAACGTLELERTPPPSDEPERAQE